MKEKLELILITYNRLEHLKNTLNSLFSEGSPVRELDLTILDNASDDGTEKLCTEYAGKYKNIKYVRNVKNIGGNANITRAFEIAKKEYVWVICDDDFYDWSAWREIEEALNTQKYDAVLTVNQSLRKKQELAKIIKELCFVPGGIYRTSLITSGVLQNAIANIPNLFPHLAIACHIVNINGSFYVPKKELIAVRGADRTPCEILYLRDNDAYIPLSTKNMFWGVGFINSVQMIKDKKIRASVINKCSDYGFFSFIFTRFRANKRYYGNYSRNIYLVWCGLNVWQKFQFAIALLLIAVAYFYTIFSRSRSAEE